MVLCVSGGFFYFFSSSSPLVVHGMSRGRRRKLLVGSKEVDGLITFWCGKVDDVAVRLEHVDLLNGRDGLHVHLLEGRLQLLVVDARGLVDLLDVPAGGSLAAV